MRKIRCCTIILTEFGNRWIKHLVVLHDSAHVWRQHYPNLCNNLSKPETSAVWLVLTISTDPVKQAWKYFNESDESEHNRYKIFSLFHMALMTETTFQKRNVITFVWSVLFCKTAYYLVFTELLKKGKEECKLIFELFKYHWFFYLIKCMITVTIISIHNLSTSELQFFIYISCWKSEYPFYIVLIIHIEGLINYKCNFCEFLGFGNYERADVNTTYKIGSIFPQERLINSYNILSLSFFLLKSTASY